MSKPKLPSGTPLPPKFKYRYTFEWFRPLTWRERIGILLGANFNVQVYFWTSASAGRVQPDFFGGTTLAKTAQQQAEYSAEVEAQLTSPDKPNTVAP